MNKEQKCDNKSNERSDNIKELVNYILNLKRRKGRENRNEPPEIKLGRRLQQRSYEELSYEMILYLISRYEIDNNKLPSKEELVEMMINFLGNIQKEPSFYKLTNNKYEMMLKVGEIIGEGSQGTIYSYNLRRFNQTKKNNKQLALKLQQFKDPYPIEIHITSAILLALYSFQPKYYSSHFMEIGYYENKSDQREFHTKNSSSFKKSTIKNNIKYFILYNFTNISDQTFNFMERQYNKEFTKIDIKHLNSETRFNNIQSNLYYFNEYEEVFKQNKDVIIKELNKLINLKEDFLLDLIIFRTERGCFKIQNNKLSKEIRCLSSCFKVELLNENASFGELLYKSKLHFKGTHLIYNPAFTWMLYILKKKNILTEKQYNYCIKRFNEMSERYEKIAEDFEIKIKENKNEFFKSIETTETTANDKKLNNKKTKDIKEINIKKYEKKRPKSKIDKVVFKINKSNNNIKGNNEENKNNQINIDFQNNEKNNKFDRLIKYNSEEKKKSKIIFNNFCKDSKQNIYFDKYETQEGVDNQNKKQKKYIFGCCCGEDAVDVME